MNIPSCITLITGIVLIIIARTVLNTQGDILQFTHFFGFILVIVGFAGLIGKLFRKKGKENIETPVSKFKYSRYIAYVLSLIILALIVLNWQDLLPVSWPIIILFVLTLFLMVGLAGRQYSNVCLFTWH